MKNAITIENYNILQGFLTTLNSQNWGSWPSTTHWPSVGVGYTCNQYSNGAKLANGQTVTATVISFNESVTMPDGTKGKKFAVGHRPSAPKNSQRL